MHIQPHLRQAVAAETDFLRKEAEHNAQMAPTELRKLGLSVFPLDCTKVAEDGNRTTFVLKASFHINDTYFYNGCKVLIHAENQKLDGRLRFFSGMEMEVQCNDEFDFNPLDPTYRIDFQPDDRTLKCMELGVHLLETKAHLQEFENDFLVEKTIPSDYTSPALNASQEKVVNAVLSGNKTIGIQGPPGTGKTTTLVAAIVELVNAKKQVIVCAPSNTAVDNVCIKLLNQSVALLRLGNDEKIHESVLPFTIEGHTEKTHGKVIDHLQKSIQKAQQTADRHVRNFNREAQDEKRIARAELRSLRTELRTLQKQLMQHLIAEIPVIAGTPVALFNQLPKEKLADYVIIDEAGQCVSPLAWLAASFGKHLVLCGDPQQLPPIIHAPKAAELGLNISLLEAVAKKQSLHLLDTQYRMGNNIVEAINPFFYDNALVSAPQLPQGECYFIDMAGYGEGERQDEITGSTYHLSEVEIVEKALTYFQLEPKDTIVLSPYNAQLDELNKILGSTWKTATIDSIQGQEIGNCVISLTRSNENGEIGFLKDLRRTNVAISRAKERCIVIGDSSTIGGNTFYNALISYAEGKGTYKSCYELL